MLFKRREAYFPNIYATRAATGSGISEARQNITVKAQRYSEPA